MALPFPISVASYVPYLQLFPQPQFHTSSPQPLYCPYFPIPFSSNSIQLSHILPSLLISFSPNSVLSAPSPCGVCCYPPILFSSLSVRSTLVPLVHTIKVNIISVLIRNGYTSQSYLAPLWVNEFPEYRPLKNNNIERCLVTNIYSIGTRNYR